jgi:7,8-dihydropterin-6-yl-methyl-4-(beta-D-ribofuranosyl)aminobenzene 5'-phosphate synthase
VIEDRAQSLLVDGTVLVSGQVERVTEFEAGFPMHEARGRDGWQGLHLTGLVFEPRIGPTVEALRAVRIGCIVHAHCSGWRAVHAIARAMPEAFVQSAVGTTVTFEAGHVPSD